MPSTSTNTTTLTPPPICKRSTVTPWQCITVPACVFGAPQYNGGPNVKTALLEDLINIAESNNIAVPNTTNLKSLCMSLALAIRDEGVNCTHNDFPKLVDNSEHGLSFACEVSSEICGNFYTPPQPCICPVNPPIDNSGTTSAAKTWKLSSIHTRSDSSTIELIEANANLFVYYDTSTAYGIRRLNKTVLLDKSQADFSIGSSSFVLPTYRSDVMFIVDGSATIYAINTTIANSTYIQPSNAPVIFSGSAPGGCFGGSKWPSLATENFIIFRCGSSCYGLDIRTSINSLPLQYFTITNCANAMQYNKSTDQFLAVSSMGGIVFLFNASSLLPASSTDLSSGADPYKIFENPSNQFTMDQAQFRGIINDTFIFAATKSGIQCALGIMQEPPHNSFAVCGMNSPNVWSIAGQYIVIGQEPNSCTFSLAAFTACTPAPCNPSSGCTHSIAGKVSASSDNIFISAQYNGQWVVKGGLPIRNLNSLPAGTYNAADDAIKIAGGFNITAPVSYYGESSLTNETIFVDARNAWYYMVPNYLLKNNISDTLFNLPMISRTSASASISLTTQFNGEILEVDGRPALLVTHDPTGQIKQIDTFIYP